ncbi:MAG TPA: SRPBCC domain-containing protein [Rhizomicrobium sp.]|nr:SRPBCC domain-containing protein [Rhizomicrobium sp.]
MDLSRRDVWAAAVAALGTTSPAGAATADGISQNHAAIHQAVMLAAPPGRIYRTLTTANLFDRVVRASAAMSSNMKKMLGAAPTQIDARPGGVFTLFGGYITGFNLELVPDARLVQAWRSGAWKPGEYSIARFVLEPHGDSTRLTFDHAGFPEDDAAQLAKGWHGNYWIPLAKALS